MGTKRSRQNEPLHEKDCFDKTFGCRHSQPSICGNNSLPDKCAFVRQDGMCFVPPSSWKKLYGKLVSADTINK